VVPVPPAPPPAAPAAPAAFTGGKEGVTDFFNVKQGF
jgi:hypothetical protein